MLQQLLTTKTSNLRYPSCLYIVLLLASTFHKGISSVKADVRCYCNLPVCVSTGYMCKSSLGVCASDHFGYDGDDSTTRSRHACLELLQNLQLQAASLECSHEKQDVASSTARPKSYPTRTCCREDMCNYARTHVTQHSNPVHRLNQSFMTGYFTNEDYLFAHGGALPPGSLSADHHVWFKAAVIAVPIAGGFILILLIVMAARMLKEDQKRQKTHEIRHETQTLDTRVVYSGPHRLLFMPKSISSAVISVHPQIHKDFTSATSVDKHEQLYQNSLYRNVSIALSTDTSCTDTSREKYFVFDV